MKYSKSYAQNAEDLILETLFEGTSKGFYVDVGANHHHNDSVTKLFYLKGWKGINIEPIKELADEFITKRPRDINLNIGASDSAGKLTLRHYTSGMHGLSTFSKDLERSVDAEYKEYKVPVQTLRAIFKKHKVTSIDFLKVDVEGFEYKVLKGNDWSKYRPRVILVENTPGEWPELLLGANYEEFFFDGLNRYYVDSNVRQGFIPELFMRQYNDLLTAELVSGLDKNDQIVHQLRTELHQMHARLGDMLARPEQNFGVKTLLRALVYKLKIKLHV